MLNAYSLKNFIYLFFIYISITFVINKFAKEGEM